MKKLFTFFFCLFYMAASAKNDYSTIHFMATKSTTDKTYPKYYEQYVKKGDFKVYLNDRVVTSVAGYEDLKIKIYSEERVTLTVIATKTYGAQHENLTLDISNGKNYYVAKFISFSPPAKNSYFKEVDSAQWRLYEPIRKTVEIEEELENPYGKIERNKRTGKGQDTCFILSSEGYLVTNYHVVENSKEITIKEIDGDFTTKYGATVVGSGPSNDLALLKISNKNIKFENPPFTIRGSGVAQTEKVYALGFPKAAAMSGEVKITEGFISAKSGVGNDISKFQISASVNSGNSGGPLIDKQGNLIGVTYAKSSIAESAGYAVKASYFLTFLDNVDGFALPVLKNTIETRPLTGKVAALKNYIFIVETN